MFLKISILRVWPFIKQIMSTTKLCVHLVKPKEDQFQIQIDTIVKGSFLVPNRVVVATSCSWMQTVAMNCNVLLSDAKRVLSVNGLLDVNRVMSMNGYWI